MSEQLLDRLRSLCEETGIRRFSAEEMCELVEDGEEISWIVEQVLPKGPAEAVEGLQTLLSELPSTAAGSDRAAISTITDSTSTDLQEIEPDSQSLDARDSLAHPDPGADLDLCALDGLQLPPGIGQSELQQVLSSPRGALLADFGSFCQEQGASTESMQTLAPSGMDGELRQLHEAWLQTPRDALEGKKPAELLPGGLFPEKVETVRRDSPKVGRNDPCPCGSGRKFKKCCGKGE